MVMATESQADYEWAHNVGRDNPDREWVLSDRDVWYRNPFYTGKPTGRHPEDDHYYDDEDSSDFNHQAMVSKHESSLDWEDIPF